MAIKSETELYEPVKRLFEDLGYTVRSEVRHCDLVACREDDKELIIVELKKTFNLALLFQLMDRLKLSDFVYAAVEFDPKKRISTGSSWSDAIRLCNKLGVGLIGVQFYKRKAPTVDIMCRPGAETAGRRSLIGAKRLRSEFARRSGDYNVGGSTGTALMTSYREKALRLAYVLSLHDTLKPRELRERLHEPAAATMLQDNYYGWFERVKRGVYRLTEAGRSALHRYETVVRSFDTHSK